MTFNYHDIFHQSIYKQSEWITTKNVIIEFKYWHSGATESYITIN